MITIGRRWTREVQLIAILTTKVALGAISRTPFRQLATVYILFKIFSKTYKCTTYISTVFGAWSKLMRYKVYKDTIVNEREQLLQQGDEYPFLHKVAAEVVLRMGGRPTTPAELKAARLLAWRIMRSTDHRIAHCERDMPGIMALVATPTEVEEMMDTAVQAGSFFPRDISQERQLAAQLVPSYPVVVPNN